MVGRLSSSAQLARLLLEAENFFEIARTSPLCFSCYWYWYLEHDEILILVFNVSEFFREHTQNSLRGHSENTLWSVSSFAGLQGGRM